MHIGHNGRVTNITSDWRDRADRHAPRSAQHPADRPVPEIYYPADPDVDLFCIACTPELREGGWQHDRACVIGRRRTA